MNISLTCKDCGETVHRNEDYTKWYEYSPPLKKCVLTNIPTDEMIIDAISRKQKERA